MPRGRETQKKSEAITTAAIGFFTRPVHYRTLGEALAPESISLSEYNPSLLGGMRQRGWSDLRPFLPLHHGSLTLSEDRRDRSTRNTEATRRRRV